MSGATNMPRNSPQSQIWDVQEAIDYVKDLAELKPW